MLAKLQAGGSGWDVFVPTNYTITTYVGEDLIGRNHVSLELRVNAAYALGLAGSRTESLDERRFVLHFLEHLQGLSEIIHGPPHHVDGRGGVGF